MSKLQLNEPTKNYDYYEGRNIDKMPELIANGRVPLSVAGLMQRRLEVLNSSQKVKESWWDYYFDTGDGIAYHPDGNIKIVSDSQHLRELNPESKLRNGSLVLDNNIYEKLNGEEFTREQIKEHIGEGLTKKGAKSNPIWNALARESKLLNDYVDAVFYEGKERFGNEKNMQVYVTSPQNVPTMRLWYVGGLGGISDAYGSGHLDGSDGRLVGVVPEAHRSHKNFAPEKPLENRIQTALNQGEAFDFNGTVYVPVSDKQVKAY